MNLTQFTSVLEQCQFNDWRFRVGQDGDRAFLQVVANGICADAGEPITWHGRKWFLSPHMTRSEIVQTAFKAVMTAVEHETRESFRYRGVAIFCPHYDVDKLVEFSAPGAFDKRA